MHAKTTNITLIPYLQTGAAATWIIPGDPGAVLMQNLKVHPNLNAIVQIV